MPEGEIGWIEIRDILKHAQDMLAVSPREPLTYRTVFERCEKEFAEYLRTRCAYDRKGTRRILRRKFAWIVGRARQQQEQEYMAELKKFIRAHGWNNVESMRRVREFSTLLRAKLTTRKAPPELAPEAFARHLEKLFNFDPATFEAKFKRKHCPKAKPSEVVWDLARLPTVDEVRDVCLKMKSGKAPGSDGLCPELFRLGVPDFYEKLTAVMTEFWPIAHGGKGKPIPLAWCAATVFSLYKSGDPTDPSNYRGIFLLNLAGKALARLICERIEPLVDRVLGPTQHGFRPFMSTTHAILSLRLCQQAAYQKGTPMLALFIDISKAFDSPPRTAFKQVLDAIGVPAPLTSVLMGFYQDCENKVAGSKRSFVMSRGVRQGSVEGPMLWNLVWRYIVKIALDGLGIGFKFETAEDGSAFDSVTGETEPFEIRELLFADDLVVICRSARLATAVLNRLEATGARLGVHVSAKKTKVLWLCGSPQGEVDRVR